MNHIDKQVEYLKLYPMEVQNWLTIINSIILVITIIAIWRSPIQAVRVGRKLQTEYELNNRLYDNKLNVFSTIIGERHRSGYSDWFIISMNQIPIVFHKNERVKSTYNVFIKSHQEGEDDQVLNAKMNDLIVEMGKDLGYHEMNNEWISNCFYPKVAVFRDQAGYYQNYNYLRGINIVPPEV